MKNEVDECSTVRNLPRFQAMSPTNPRFHCEFCGNADVIEGEELAHYPDCLKVPIECLLCGTVLLNHCLQLHKGTCPVKLLRAKPNGKHILERASPIVVLDVCKTSSSCGPSWRGPPCLR